jgi:hypothetical protein
MWLIEIILEIVGIILDTFLSWFFPKKWTLAIKKSLWLEVFVTILFCLVLLLFFIIFIAWANTKS